MTRTPSRLPRGRDAVSRVLAVALLLVVGMAAPGAAQPPPRITMDDPSWRLESTRDGIALYCAEVVGTGIVPWKAVMAIPGTIEEVSTVLEDIPRRGDWIDRFGLSVLLERASDYEQVEYLRVRMPWPVRDRSALIRVRIAVSDDLRRATIAAASDESHPHDTLPVLVRSLVYASTFQMTQVGDHVEVAALVFIDPRGRIPKWVVNYFTSGVARTTLEGLRRQVARGLYSPQQTEALHARMAAYRSFQQLRAGPPE